jgi:hypothetical protein
MNHLPRFFRLPDSIVILIFSKFSVIKLFNLHGPANLRFEEKNNNLSPVIKIKIINMILILNYKFNQIFMNKIKVFIIYLINQTNNNILGLLIRHLNVFLIFLCLDGF